MALHSKIIELEFTTLVFYDKYVISQLKADQIFQKKQVTDLIEVCSDHYEGKNFVYLSYRINDYNVNPTIYLNLETVKNLAGIGIISTRSASLNMAFFEKNFSKVPFEVFMAMESALEWVEEIIEEKNKKADL